MVGKAAPVALILAGGSGTRFWPASHKKLPKQYLSLGNGSASLIQDTYARLKKLVGPQIYLCTTQEQLALIQTQLPELPLAHLILEPEGKNTGPGIAYSTLELLRRGIPPETPVIVCPADHQIGDPNAFIQLAQLTLQEAFKSPSLFTFGITPTSPHTGYGYIESAQEEAERPFRKIKRFVEKPNLEKAQEYLASGKFFWNSGIFVWTLATIERAFKELQPELYELLENLPAKVAYPKLKSVPIDIAIMEKAKNGMVLPASMAWSDLGTWNAVYESIVSTPGQTISLAGQTKTWNSSGCLVRCPDRNVALIGVSNLIVVEEGKNLLIVVRSQDQEVRLAAKEFDI